MFKVGNYDVGKEIRKRELLGVNNFNVANDEVNLTYREGVIHLVADNDVVLGGEYISCFITTLGDIYVDDLSSTRIYLESKNIYLSGRISKPILTESCDRIVVNSELDNVLYKTVILGKDDCSSFTVDGKVISDNLYEHCWASYVKYKGVEIVNTGEPGDIKVIGDNEQLMNDLGTLVISSDRVKVTEYSSVHFLLKEKGYIRYYVKYNRLKKFLDETNNGIEHDYS